MSITKVTRHFREMASLLITFLTSRQIIAGLTALHNF